MNRSPHRSAKILPDEHADNAMFHAPCPSNRSISTQYAVWKLITKLGRRQWPCLIGREPESAPTQLTGLNVQEVLLRALMESDKRRHQGYNELDY